MTTPTRRGSETTDRRKGLILALVLLIIVGGLLYILLRGSMNDDSDGSASPGGASPEPTKVQGLVGEYPSACIEPAPEPRESLVAYVHEKGIGVTEVPGKTRVVIDDSVPFKWSPTGTYLATGSGTVYDANGDEVDQMFDDGEEHAWGWSPIADCAIVADADGALQVFVPGEKTQPLIDNRTNGFTFSPGGGTLAYLVPKGDTIELWIASLGKQDADRIAKLDAADGDVVLAGWTPDAGHVLFWQGEGITDPGTKLKAAAKGEVTELETVLAHRDLLDACGKKVVAVVGKGARDESNTKQIVYLAPQEEPQTVTPTDTYDISPRCSPEGEEIAVVRSPSPTGEERRALVVVDKAGSPVQEPTSDVAYNDAYPMWGRGDFGILFVRVPVDGSRAELWHFERQQTPEPTEAVLDEIAGDPELARDGWGHWIDWNADLPFATSVVSPPN